MNNQSPAQTPLAQLLSGLPADVAAIISHKLSSIIKYEPVIGLMGKTGAGKSSLCNTLFRTPPAKVDAVRGCTRHIQRYQVCHDNRILYIVDFPGIGETPELDRIYCRLYREESPGLDLVVWVLKADDRAWKDDLRCYHELLTAGAKPESFLFVLSQADKIEPCREWDLPGHRPSPQQAIHLIARAELAATLFAAVHPVIAVSAAEHYNLELWAEALLRALPVRSSSPVSSHLHPELRTETAVRIARERFVSVAADIFDDATVVLQRSGTLIQHFQYLRRQFLSVIRAVWRFLF
ncbi:50S ribosome-binding GTPase [Enterobacter cloacae]|uniref:GTPase family protein n=1 Tax=Enterobacter cloacae TaxID=550 RepID=UPI002004FCDA|nr:GTPase [Enterobacter cloacae]MCK7319919.1 50S ribosome-binding GTPase [Enterobacter cloacae]